MGGMFGGGKPNKEDYQNGYQPDEDLRSRYLAVIDKYMADKGMADYIPRENRPYELRDDRERGEWRNATQNPVIGGSIQKPSLNDGSHFDSKPVQNQGPTAPPSNNPNFKPLNNNRGQGGTDMPNAAPANGSVFKDARPANPERQVSSQMVAPTQTAPQNNKVPLATNAAFFEEDQRRKQEEYNRVKDYIYRDNRSR